MKERISAGEIVGPEMFYSGPLLESSPLMHAEANEKLPGFTVAINSVADVDSILRGLARKGACMVKTFNKINPQLYRHLLEVARSCSLRVVHDPGEPLFNLIPIDTALALGVTSIEHAKAPWPVILTDEFKEKHDSLIASDASPGARMALAMKIMSAGTMSVSTDKLEHLAEEMKSKGAYLCPTLQVLPGLEAMAIEQVKGQFKVDTIPPQMLAMIKTQVGSMQDVSRLCVREFAKCGVKMLVGQDGCDPRGTTKEMKSMEECGVSPGEILKGATIYPATWLGVERRLGSIAEGKQANIVIVNQNPLENIGNIDSIFLVLQNGHRTN
jgi:hypothetical protein